MALHVIPMVTRTEVNKEESLPDGVEEGLNLNSIQQELISNLLTVKSRLSPSKSDIHAPRSEQDHL